MGTATSKSDESEIENVRNGESETPTEEDRNEYKGDNNAGDNQDNKDPVIEEEIIPTEGIQVRSFLEAPIVCPPGYRMDAKGRCRKVQ
ncbi:hypothetical protein HA402_014463 [Bradysia odoriphaga]|nr:hypothetical protein HA402_014463 [Bradysia odoriphaga]